MSVKKSKSIPPSLPNSTGKDHSAFDALRSDYEELAALNRELAQRVDERTSALHESEKRFRMMFEKAPDAGYLINFSGELMDANQALVELVGYPREELVGMNVFESGLLMAGFHSTAREQLARLAQDERVEPVEVHLLRKDGTEIAIEVTSMPVHIEGQAVVLGSARNLMHRKLVEKTLRESEERFRIIFDNVPDGILLANPETRKFRMASKAICTRLGYSEKQVLEMGSEGIHPTEDLPYVIDAFKRQARGEVEEVFDIPFLCRNGDIFYADMKAFPILLDGQQYLLGHVRDITERRRLRQALEKRVLALTRPLDGEDFVSFEDLFNLKDIQRMQDDFSRATGVASIITRPDGVPITEPSSFTDFCSLIVRGTEKGNINCIKSDAELGRHHQKGPIVLQCLSAGLWDAGASIEVGGRHIANWLIGQVRDESQTDGQMRAYAREIGADEEALLEAFHRVQVMPREQFEHIAQALFTLANQLSTSAYQNMQQARFIAGQKEAEQALQESEEKYRLIFESESDAIMIIDRESRQFIDVNHAAVELYGYSPEEFLELTHQEISVEPEVLDSTLPAMLAGQSVATLESVHRKKDGSVFPVEITPCTFSWQGRPVVCGVIRDISQRVAREEEIDHNRKELRHLASELSQAGQHERQRIAAELHDGVSQFLSSSFIQLGVLRESPLPETTIKSIDKISGILHESLQQIRSLTFDLNYPMLTEQGLASALDGLCSSMTGEHAVRFEFHGDVRPLPLPLECQIVLFRSVRELLNNVMKHSGAEHAQVKLEHDGDNMRISIKDDGRGFDAATAGKGFSPSGGFGLFSIREYLQHSGGSLEIESAPGEGTEVVLSVPLVTEL